VSSTGNTPTALWSSGCSVVAPAGV
jgi:hypothetical protein